MLKSITSTAFCALALLSTNAMAQPAPARGPSQDMSNSPVVTRMMAFDKNGDGKVGKDEVTDDRLQSIFARADANSDGVATKEELVALAGKIDAESGQGGDMGGRRGGGPGGGGAGGRGGPGGPGGRGGPGGPQPGQVLPMPLREQLNLTAEQNQQLDELQREVDDKLGKILTSEQKSQLQQMRGRGQGRGGPPPQ